MVKTEICQWARIAESVKFSPWQISIQSHVEFCLFVFYVDINFVFLQMNTQMEEKRALLREKEA